jgi:uncharacterized membrane protein
MSFTEVIEATATVIDAAGVAAIVIGALIATVAYFNRLVKKAELDTAFRAYRQGLGKATLLGLEFLVASDIIRTVAISPTFESLGVLALIVAVRTFLSFALQLELEGRWPWQARDAAPQAAASTS